MRESQRPSPGYSTTRNIPELKDRFSVPVQKERLDEMLLELILVDTVALADPRRGPLAERLIERAMSPSDYTRVLDRYDELSDDDDDETGLIEFCFKRASAKDSHWKSKMLRWFTQIVGGGNPLSSDELIEVAGLASAMGANREWEALSRAGQR
jgi:hypothetical protein